MVARGTPYLHDLWLNCKHFLSISFLIHDSHVVDSTPYDIQIHTWEDDTEFVGQECYTFVSEAYQVSEIMRME